MANISTRIGDVFSVKLDNDKRKYFQLIAFDILQLNSDVIRAFKKEYSEDSLPTLHEVINDNVDFYAHCVTKFGLKMNLWNKIGSIKDVGDIKDILFRGTEDSGSQPGEQIILSNRWYVWRINDKDFTIVGKLEGEYRKAEIGVVVKPVHISSFIRDLSEWYLRQKVVTISTLI